MCATPIEMQWAHDLFSYAELGDIRRTNRLIKVAADLSHFSGASFSKANAADEAALEAAYRFIRNQAVYPQAILEAGFLATAQKVKDRPYLLAVEDTTTLSYWHGAAEELGDLGGPEQASGRGFFVHSTLLLDGKSESTLGLIEQHYWIREPEGRGKRHARRQREYLDKESYKWQRASEAMRMRLGAEVMPQVVSVCDRESDVYQYISYKQQNQERYILRASWNRRVEMEGNPEGQNASHLFSALSHAEQVASLTVQVPQRGGREARTAELTVQRLRLRLKRPMNGTGRRGPAHLGVNVVVALEIDPPSEVEPLQWLLLTSEPVNTPEEVLEVLRCYKLRWRVEEYHKAWKSGVGVERQRHQSADNLHRAAVILSFVAVRLLQLREAVEQNPEGSCEQVFDPTMWRVLWAIVEKTRPPAKPPSAKWAYFALGKLARWTDSKRTGRIGWQTLFRGWYELELRVEGYLASRFLSEGEM